MSPEKKYLAPTLLEAALELLMNALGLHTDKPGSQISRPIKDKELVNLGKEFVKQAGTSPEALSTAKQVFNLSDDQLKEVRDSMPQKRGRESVH